MKKILLLKSEIKIIEGQFDLIEEETEMIKEKFPHGSYCKKGDFVIFRSYSGTRFKVHGKEFRLINDDTVEAVVEDPRGYSRA